MYSKTYGRYVRLYFFRALQYESLESLQAMLSQLFVGVGGVLQNFGRYSPQLLAKPVPRLTTATMTT